MDINNLINIIRSNSAEKDVINTADLTQLYDRYPYCEIFIDLLTFNHYQQNKKLSPGLLAKAATHKLNTPYLYNLLQTSDISATESSLNEDEVSDEPEVSSNDNAHINSEPAQLDAINIEPIETKEAELEKLKHDFNKQILSQAVSNQISLDANQNVDDLKSEIDDAVTENAVIADKLSFSNWLGALSNPSPAKQKSNLESVEGLIDTFIKNEPNISKGKVEFYSASEMGKKSLEESDELITETLAKIFEQQGHIQKAINAYRTLGLKYPEKSTYFAALLKEAEKKLNK